MIVVVGGGITGLAIGWELQRLGVDFLVLEASGRPGGVIRSGEIEGHIVDWGPQRTRLTAGIARLVHDLDLGSEVVTAPSDLELCVFLGEGLRRVPFSVTGFAASDAVSLGGKLRALLEPFTAPAHAEESVSHFFSRKFGREMYEVVIGPLYGGLYASDPADMQVGLSLIHVLRGFGVRRSMLLRLLRHGGRIVAPPACSFREGMQALPDALARRLGDRFRTDAPVRGISVRGSGWRIRLEGGESVEAERVVVTTPAPAAADILRAVAPAASNAMAQVRYNPLAVVHLEAETELRGMGFQVSLTERDLTLRGVTFNDSLFGRSHLYTAYLGGALHPEVSTLSAEVLSALAAAEFRRTTGYEARPLCTEHVHMPAWDRSWHVLAGLSVPEGIHLAGSWWSRPGLGGRLAEARTLSQELTARKRENPG